MKILSYQIIELNVPYDTFLLLKVETEHNLIGWGEMTGAINSNAAIAFAKEGLGKMLGQDATDICARMADFKRFRVMPLADQCAKIAWSAIEQALWDLKSQAAGLPLHKLLNNCSEGGPIRLYANLNRGLLRDRSPYAFATNAAAALKEGFKFAKATPFDEVTPQTDSNSLFRGMERVQAVFDAIPREYVAIDGHWRFNRITGTEAIERILHDGSIYWLEDFFMLSYSQSQLKSLQRRFAAATWAAGEYVTTEAEGTTLLNGDAIPDVFMPDIKYIVGLKETMNLLKQAKAKGCRVSIHNPSGPVATAHSAHVAAAVGLDEPLEYCFDAVKNRELLTSPQERVESGRYYLQDRAGIGITISDEQLELFGDLKVRVTL